jgi:hypothetical protein
MIGPLPPVQDLEFRFHEYAGEGSYWRVMHGTDLCFVVEAEGSDEYVDSTLLPMEESLCSDDFQKFLNSIVDHAIIAGPNLADQYALDIITSLGFTPDVSLRNDPDLLWRMSPGYVREKRPSVAEEVAEELFP